MLENTQTDISVLETASEGRPNRNTNIQDTFLNTLRKDRFPIVVYLVNGFQLRGLVKSFDNYVILLESEGKTSMVYKHAISTISPVKE